MKSTLRAALAWENILWIALIAFIGIVGLISPRFLSVDNVTLILYSSAVLGIVAIAETIVILSGGIDISVGAILAISASAISELVKSGCPAFLAVLIGLAAGIGLGLMNGTLTAYLRLPAIIATLATLNLFRGAIDVVLGGRTIPPPSDQLEFLASGTIGPLHVQVVAFLFIALLVSLILAHTRLGRLIYAVGSNSQAAEMAGVNVKNVRLMVYMMSGVLAATAGLLFATRSASITRTAGLGIEFTSIGAVVLGGASLFGGSGRIRGTVAGVILLYAIYNAMVIAGITATWQNAATGALIIVVVSLNIFKWRFRND